MQTRTCFNGGELSPELAERADLDVYMRGCRKLENWELSQMGGVKRRRGMRPFAVAEGAGSRLFPYIYSYGEGADMRFLVEADTRLVRVFSEEGEQVAKFDWGEGGMVSPDRLRVLQLNSMLLFTCETMPPMVLQRDDEEWTLTRWTFKCPPWRYEHERRDWPLMLTRRAGATRAVYEVDFSQVQDEGETGCEEAGEVLRLSFWLEQAEAQERGEALRQGVRQVEDLQAATQGDKLALHTDMVNTYWVCKKEFPGDVYVEGLDDPACYPDNFAKAENTEGFAGIEPVTSVHQVNNGGTIPKGKKFAIKAGYWEYFTCIRTFTAADMVAGATSYADYPGFFVRGLAVGEALPCRGKWTFSCGGLWYGSYEVRRCYTGRELSREWESVGSSFSRVEGASNIQPTGDEEAEACYLRLFLTRSKYMTPGLAAGFPPDSCGNRLVVNGYRHDILLTMDGEENGQPVFVCKDDVQVNWTGQRTVRDWSWGAFAQRYGYPAAAHWYNQRLVFASTAEQPQSIWLSRVDDLNNFATGKADDAALALTLATRTQNPINWLQVHRNRLLLGTSEAEWVVSPGDRAGGITAANATVEKHGSRGSEFGLSLEADSRVIFIERGAGRCLEYAYSDELNGYRNTDLTVFAPHVLAEHGGARRLTVLHKPDLALVAACGDGQVALCTYNNAHEVHAWHRWSTDGTVLDVCGMPDGRNPDRLFLLVQRGEAVNIEVVDEASPYEDNGGRDYVSTLVTNHLGNTLEQKVGKAPKHPVMVRFGDPCPTADIEFCTEGSPWVPPASNDPHLPAGWVQVLTVNKWEFDSCVGLRVHGATGCHVLALQG